jgi:hypothetical protein
LNVCRPSPQPYNQLSPPPLVRPACCAYERHATQIAAQTKHPRSSPMAGQNCITLCAGGKWRPSLPGPHPQTSHSSRTARDALTVSEFVMELAAATQAASKQPHEPEVLGGHRGVTRGALVRACTHYLPTAHTRTSHTAWFISHAHRRVGPTSRHAVDLWMSCYITPLRAHTNI